MTKATRTVPVLAFLRERGRREGAGAAPRLEGVSPARAHAAAIRAAERARIARELHDALGHHLTVLGLNLEVAARLTAPGPALEHLERAREAARLLLAEVRGAVGAPEGEAPPDLGAALAALCRPLPGVRVHLRVSEGVGPADPRRGHALLRCAQEAVANALRHGRPRTLWLELEPAAGELVLRVRDDGRGAAAVRPGRGLTGMRGRLEALGGRLELETEPGGGFSVEAWVPWDPSPGP